MTTALPLKRLRAADADPREISQANLRVFIFLGCAIYCFARYNTPYLRAITLFAFLSTLFWMAMAWRRVGSDRVRHIGALAYDCLIIGLVMIGFGSGFMGMFAILLWVSLGYGLRYRSLLYLKLGSILTCSTFIISALVTHWGDIGIFLTLLVTLALIPLALRRPIAEMIQLLERLDATNKLLDAANQTKDRFISDVSHDLLTPVNSILGYCQLSPPAIDGIRINAYQLTRQIRAMIGHAAAKDLGFDEPLEPFSPADLLREVAAIVKPMADHRGMTIETRNGCGYTIFRGAFQSLSICLMNLTSNAVKHSCGSHVTISVEEGLGELLFQVTDDGVGIPADQQARVFGRFQRGTTPDVDGLGLGLAIVKDTIQRIGGHVHLESSAGGSTFRIFAPVKPISESDMQVSRALSPAPDPAVAHMGAVLFVDDAFQSRKAWSSVLREAGYSVHASASGPEALSAIDAGNRYDVCVLDYHMPGMDGVELATAIRERHPTMRLIAITSDDLRAHPPRLMGALAERVLDEALQKPLHPATLLSTVERLRPASQDAEPSLQPMALSIQ